MCFDAEVEGSIRRTFRRVRRSRGRLGMQEVFLRQEMDRSCASKGGGRDVPS